MKKILVMLIIFILLIVVLSNYILASTTQYACSIGSYGINIDASKIQEIANHSKNTYSGLGYSISNYLIDPSPLVIFSNALSSNVQFYFSHGNQNKIEFVNGGLCLGNSTSTDSTGKEYYGIGMIDWTNKKLVTLAACQTAGENYVNNTSIAGWIAELGAQMSVGWYTEIYALTGIEWLKNYNNKLAAGETVSAAIIYANSQSYNDNSYKNVVLFNSGNITGINNINTTNQINNEIKNDRNILANNSKTKLTTTEIENIIKTNNPQFNSNDYQVTISEGSYTYNIKTKEKEKLASYIDYNLKIGDFITNSGYTVVLDKNNTVIEINDNTIDIPTAILAKTSQNTISVSDRIYYLNKAKTEIGNEYDILDEEISFHYDLKENKKYVCVKLKTYSNIFGNESKVSYFEI